MRAVLLLTVAALLQGALARAASGQAAAASDTRPEELLLVGTVKRIYQLNAPRSRRRWAVEVRVVRVVSGEFNGPLFTFAVHSPSLSGLRVRRTYNIKARRVDAGYLVDEQALEEVRPVKKSPGRR